MIKKVAFLLLVLMTNLSFSQHIKLLNFSGGNEPSVAVNPNNNAEMILAFNTNTVLKSNDTGKTFSKIKVSSDYGFYGDPVLYWSKNNSIYLAHLAKNKKLKWPESFDRIVFQTGNFKQKKWSKSTGIGYSLGKMQDKPWFSVDENLNSKFYNRIYITWTQFDKYGSKNPLDSSRILFSYSTDNGKNFSQATSISIENGDCQDGDNTLEGATTCVDSNGNVHCVWSGYDKLWYTCSKDGGINWVKPMVVSEHKDGWSMKPPNIYRANGMPFIQIVDGKLLLIWAQKEENNKNKIMIKWKNLNEDVWSENQYLNDNLNDDLIGEYMPNMVVSKGKVYIVYYQCENKIRDEKTYSIVVSELKFLGNRVEVIHKELIQSEFNAQNNAFIGDYLGIDDLNQLDNEVMVAYTMLDKNNKSYIVVERVNF